jgi:CCR4-NOT transcription complex subunit 1
MLCLKTKIRFQQVLLQSDLIKSSSEERSLLKNLGSWLGKFTIGRNQTLRAKEIDPKILIVEVCASILISFLFSLHSVIICHAHTITCTFCC